MMKRIDAAIFIKKHWAVAALAIICGVFALLHSGGKAQLLVEMTSTGENHLQVFWATEKLGYEAERSLSKNTETGTRTYTFLLDKFSQLRRIRIDPQSAATDKTPAPVTIHSIRLKNRGIKDIVFQSTDSFSHLIPLWDIGSMEFEPGQGLKMYFDGDDPALEFEIRKKTEWLIVLAPGLILLLLHWFLSSSANKGSKKKAFSYVRIRKSPSVPVFDDFIKLLKNKKLLVRHISLSETEDEMTAHFLLTLPNPQSFYGVINEFPYKENIINSGITFHRAGEIN